MAVHLVTVKALLTEVALRRIQVVPYRFCDNGGCDVVYFGGASTCFETHDVRVPVWHKEVPGQRLLCYCFGESEAGIRAELLLNGRVEVVDRIRLHIASHRCACDLRNPRGTCCLGDVIAAVRRIQVEIADGQRMKDGIFAHRPDR